MHQGDGKMVEGKRYLAFPGGFGPVSCNGNLCGHVWGGDGVGEYKAGGHVERTEVERMPLEGFGQIGRLEDQSGKRKVLGNKCCPLKE